MKNLNVIHQANKKNNKLNLNRINAKYAILEQAKKEFQYQRLENDRINTNSNKNKNAKDSSQNKSNSKKDTYGDNLNITEDNIQSEGLRYKNYYIDSNNENNNKSKKYNNI